MAAHKRNRFQIEQDLVFIAERYCEEMPQAKIAEALAGERPYKITQQQVSHDIKKIRERWRASAVRNFDDARAQELAKIDHVEAVAWAAWERSVGEMTRRTNEKRSGPHGYNGDKTVAWEEAGDPRFLQGVQKCIEMRCKLLGLVTDKFEGKIIGGGGAPLLVQIVAAGTAEAGDE